MDTLWVLCAIASLLLSFPVKCHGEVAGETQPARLAVRNGSLDARGTLSVEKVATLRHDGWTCPDAKDWPHSWSGQGGGVKIEWPASGGRNNDGYGKLSGGLNGYVNGYWGEFFKGGEIYVVWARGKGTLRVGIMAYKFSDDHKDILPGGRMPPFDIKVNTDVWVRYRYLMKKPEYELAGHPLLQAPDGEIDFDDVDIVDSDPALDWIVEEESKLYGTGALIEDLDNVKADDLFAEKAKSYLEAVAAFRQAQSALKPDLAASVEKQISRLASYVLTKNISAVQAPYYNDMIVLTRVLNALAGKQVEAPATLKATRATISIDHTPGVRALKPDTVRVTAIEPNKILYEESEDAMVKVTLKSTTHTEQQVTLVALQYADLDVRREVARESMSIAAGGERTWTIRYNVGPETYGRALEVRIRDAAGKELDHWEEYYQVAKEWLRVQMHSVPSRYSNMGHYFASEPTDWGVQPTDAGEWKSAQAGYPINPANRLYQMKASQSKGRKFTFYQNAAFGGIMGYEQMRKHPEYVLYDPNGQFAVDPVYGGYPNPMEIASPIEIGPKRAPRKPYLDRTYTPWQHALANFALEETVEYGARCIKKYAQLQGFDGIFIDGTMVVMQGYGYDGKINIPAAKKEVARLNARIQNIYHRVLKEENPYFGTWYNHSLPAVEGLRAFYSSSFLLGSGVGDDSDEWIREMNHWKNVSCLMELQTTLHLGAGPDRHPKECLEKLCENRDYIVQKYGGNVIVGYLQGMPISIDKPGLSKWGWPAVNYFMGEIIASQNHVVVAGSFPSFEPSFQFQTRYSSLLWAPDIKVVPEAEKGVSLKAPEPLWWKPLVYRRNTKDGYDLIIHLLRIPPTEKWDLNWVDEPSPLAEVSLTARIDSGVLTSAYACRPYHFEEEQQVVQQALKAEVVGNKATVMVSPFRYHTMVVLRIKAVPGK